MTRFLVALGFLGLMASVVAAAQPVSGPYVAGAGGINLRAPQSMTIEPPKPAPTQTEAAPLPNSGATAAGSAGYGFGNGWRMEVEGSRRR